MTKTNQRRLAVAIVTAYIADIVFNMVYHGFLTIDSFNSVSDLWRPAGEMQSLMSYCFLGHLILVSIGGVMFARGYENKGNMEGFRFGLLLGLVLASQTIVSFAYLPLPNFILSIFLLGNLLEGVVIGLFLAIAFRINLADEKHVAAKAVKKPAAKSKKK